MKLQINDLKAAIDGKEILKGINLELETGKIYALMGPNGSGKSTLANVLMGHPSYEVTGGSVHLDGKDLLAMDSRDRALAGLYLAFQYPVEIPGLRVSQFLKRASELRLPEGTRLNLSAFLKELREEMAYLEMEPDFMNRYLNEGFSGGEKKRMEILQMLMFKPALAMLDETDSGLDIDALKIVSKGVNSLRGKGFGALVITHYQRLLDHIPPDRIHIMFDGRIVKSGGPELALQLEQDGYDWIREEAHETAAASS